MELINIIQNKFTSKFTCKSGIKKFAINCNCNSDKAIRRRENYEKFIMECLKMHI